MNDWLSLPSGEMARVSEIAFVEDHPPPVGRYSRVSEIVFRNGCRLLTPWSVADVQRQIREIEKNVTGRLEQAIEWHLSTRVREAYKGYQQTASDAGNAHVSLVEWLSMVAEDYLALQSRNSRTSSGIGYDGAPEPGPGE